MKLAGIRVLDFGQFLAGPLVSRVMADHGAEVIKIESPEGDPTRRNNRRPGQVASDFFAALNRGKRSVVLDLKDPATRPALEALVRSADVLVESFSPGVTRRLGIDYDTVSALNPRLVYASVTAFGQNGPLSGIPAHDPLVQAMAGILPRNEDGAPIAAGVSVAGLTAAWSALSGVLMALLQAKQSGRGDHLDLSMHDVALTLRPQALNSALRAGDNTTTWQHSVGIAMLELYETADGAWLALGGREPRFAKALFEALGRPDLIPAATGPVGAAQDSVRSFLRETFRSRTQAEWLQELPQALSVAPVLNYAQALAHPHVAARGMLLGSHAHDAYLNTPLRFARQPGQVAAQIPALGVDSAEMLASLSARTERSNVWPMPEASVL